MCECVLLYIIRSGNEIYTEVALKWCESAAQARHKLESGIMKCTNALTTAQSECLKFSTLPQRK